MRKNSSTLRRALPLALCLALPVGAQQQNATDKNVTQPPKAAEASRPAANDERAEQVVARALAAMGGDSYLAVRTVVGRGVLTPFARGVSQLPLSFTDYLVFPDKERTEFRGGGNRSIDTFTGQTGWGFDAAARSLKDKQPADVQSFQLSLRTSLDMLLRGWFLNDGATLA